MARLRLPFLRFSLPLILILGFVLLIFLGDTFHVFEVQELGFVDLHFRLRPPRIPHPDIVVVEIDDQSINRIGHWPWPRSYHATLLEVLSSYNPRIILYDVLFTEASTDPAEDQLLAYAMKKAGNVIAAFFYHTENPFKPFFPIAPFREAAQFLGYVNIFSDADARIRRVRPFINPPEGPYYHTSIVAVGTAFEEEAEKKRWLEGIPLDRENSFWINFPGDYAVFRRVPVHHLIKEGGVDNPEFQKLFGGKIVVVGQTATGGGDFRPTPFSPAFPGVGIQASALHTLLTREYLRRFGGVVTLLILLVSALLVGFLTWRNSPPVGFVAVSILTVFYLVWNFTVFNRLGWILPVFPVLVVIAGTYVLTLLLQFIQIRFEGELLAREISLAARIQENFLPQQGPRIEGLDVSFQCRFARTVGGDLYDWVTLGERRLGVCVGDVSGKGVPAALYMARAISEWRSLAKDFTSPAALMGALNHRLMTTASEGIFLTLVYLIFDVDSKTIVLSNAGHEPPLVFRDKEEQREWIRDGSAPPLGLFSETRYLERELSLNKGDYVILTSDGVRELRNFRGEEFGPKGMEKAATPFSSESAEGIVKRLFHAMDEFSNGGLAHDDRTVLCVKVSWPTG